MRRDGKRVKNAPPSYLVGAYFMNKRYDAQNMIEVDVPIAPISEYIRTKRGEGVRFSHLGIILAAYIRTVAEFPLLNRFFVNKRPYARTEMTVGMVVLKPGDDEGTTSKMFFELEDDIFAVQKTLDKYIGDNRVEGDANKTDDFARILVKIPGLLTLGIALLKFLDRFGLLPHSLINASPFHCSMLISNLASIGTNHIYHHCYHFGTTSLILTVGKPKDVPVRHGENVRFERCLPFGVVMDERICSGSYFSTAFSRFREYLLDPSLLEGPSRYPIVREWAKPGEYEKSKAKRLYHQEKAEIKAQKLPKKEKKAALLAAKKQKKQALMAAKSLKKASKKENVA